MIDYPKAERQSPFGLITFTLYSKREGHATASPCKVNNVEYESMRIDFRVSDNPHIRTFVDYQSISLRREGSFDSHGTDKAREKIRTFVLAEAEKLFKDPEFSEKANSREIWSYLSRAESEVSELNAKLMVAQQRVAELKAQFSRNGDFCLAIADKYRNKVCKRPKGHTGAHNDFSR